MHKLYKITQQTFWQSLVKFSTTICGFIVIGLISRTYGEAGTGEFTLALVYIAFFYILVDFAFNAHVLDRLQATGYSGQLEWRKLLGTRIIWSGSLTILAGVIVLVLPYHPPAPGFSPNFKIAALFLLINIILNGIIATSSGLFQARFKYQYNTFGPIFGAVAGTFLIFIFITLRLPVYLAVLGYVLAWISEAVFALIFVRKLVQRLSPVFDLNYMKKLLLEVWPFSATLILNVLYFRADAFILQYFRPSFEVGIYNVSYQVFQSILVLPTYIMNAFYPIMVENFKNKTGQFINLIKAAALGLLTISMLLLFIIYFLSPVIIKLITGSGFSGSVSSLQILSAGFPAYFLSALLMWAMVTKKMYKKLLLIYGLGLAFNVIANIILIPKYSFVAASWTTVISEYLILGMQLVILLFERSREHTNFSTRFTRPNKK